MRKLRCIGRYKIQDKTLGKGNFAVVELATHTITKTKVAIKVIDRHQIREEYVRQHLNREARILAQLRHPNIIRLYETISSSSLYCLVTEYAGGGDLLSFLRNQRDGRLRESEARPFVRQLVSALHHLHDRGVVHRDLKMENIMMDSQKKNIKIVDFGLSNCFSADQLMSTHCGSPEYAAPELFTAGTDYCGPEVDVWSLGINIYAMVCGKLPFTTPHSENRRQKLLKQLQYGLGALQDKEMSKLSDECCELLHLCIEPNPELRAPLLDIEAQPWITDNGILPFYPYQQPKKDLKTKQLIIKKMACLLDINEEKIESSVHEYRVDELSAIFNLLMDERLSAKGFWDRDHTAGQENKRSQMDEPKNAVHFEDEIPVKETKENTNPQDIGHEKGGLRTPTIIGMVRPSQAYPERRMFRSPDFELRALNGTEQMSTRRRPKTGKIYQSSNKVKPICNATVDNIISARCNHLGNTSSSGHLQTQTHQVCGECNVCQQMPRSEWTKEQTFPAQVLSNTAAKTIASTIKKCVKLQSCNDVKSESRQENRERTVVVAVEENKVISKSPNLVHDSQRQLESHKCNNCTCAMMDPNSSDSQKEVKIINMAKYFNKKHGYKIRETPVTHANVRSTESVMKSKSDPRTKATESFTLCDSHREQVTSELLQAAPVVVYRRATPYSGPGLRIEDDSQSPATIDIKLPRQDEGYQSDSESERGRSITPQKAKWRPRLFQTFPRSTSSRLSSSSRYSPCPHYCELSPPCRSPNMTPTNDRQLFCTPVVSLQPIQDIPHSMHVPMEEVDAMASADNDTTKNRMPQRLSWKRQGILDTSAFKTVAEKTDGTRARELMLRNSLCERYPQAGMRLHSAKLRTPPPPKSGRSGKSRSIRTAPPHSTPSRNGRGPKQASVHSSCKAPLARNAFMMDKYSGGSAPQDQPLTATSDSKHVINLSKQHMLTLLQEASATLENTAKLAERKKCQSKLHYYHHTSHQRQPEKPWQKAINQLKPHHYSAEALNNKPTTDALDIDKESHVDRTVAGRSRPSTVKTEGKSRWGGARFVDGIAKQLGQRVTYVEGTLNLKTERPPTVTPTKASERVFDVETSRHIQLVSPSQNMKEEVINYRQTKMDDHHSQSDENSKGWNVGYFLERKLSNTLKGGDSISKMRNAPYSH